MSYAHAERIVAVSQFTLTFFRARYRQVSSIVGDGLNLPFADKSFAIAYSNAVIEHAGDRDRQIQFLKELRRVGRKGYVTTPSRYFPVEVHTRIPLLHLVMSKTRFDRFITRIGKGWAAGDYMHLLGRKDLEGMLSAAGIADYTISTSRLVGFPLTYTVVWGA